MPKERKKNVVHKQAQNDLLLGIVSGDVCSELTPGYEEKQCSVIKMILIKQLKREYICQCVNDPVPAKAVVISARKTPFFSGN